MASLADRNFDGRKRGDLFDVRLNRGIANGAVAYPENRATVFLAHASRCGVDWPVWRHEDAGRLLRAISRRFARHHDDARRVPRIDWDCAGGFCSFRSCGTNQILATNSSTGSHARNGLPTQRKRGR